MISYSCLMTLYNYTPYAMLCLLNDTTLLTRDG
jgi:hypothetical protein